VNKFRRKPTLADLVLAQSPLEPTFIASSWRNQSLDWLRVAKRFVLDESAARFLARMIRECPRVIADAQDFAIQPYSQMWIELPYDVFYRDLTNNAPFVQRPPDGTEDKRVGYLFSGPAVRVFSESTAGVGVLPLQFHLHRPMSPDEELKLADALNVSRIGLDLWFWGSTAMAYLGALCKNADTDDAHEWDRAGLRALRENHGVSMAPIVRGFDAEFAQNKGWQQIVSGSAGDLRNVVALLLFLNRTADITIADDLPMSEGFIKRKLRPFLSHRVIKLKLDPMPRLRRLSAGLGIKRRLHDVRGHFCHDRKAREGCQHGIEHSDAWEEYDVLRWRCTLCGGKRWWRNEHKRGEPKIGEVIQTYEVTR
jgi:hypothetical protein